MKNNKTELVFILDKSGSMHHLTSDTIGGFNSMLDKQKQLEGEAFVTTYLFNDRSVMIHDRVPIADVKSLTEEDYQASGCTALLDAMGSAIKHIAGIHRYARAEDVPEHTIFVITTDGMENSSHVFNADEVRRMVTHEQEKYNWEFIFLGANIDSVETASYYGIKSDNAVNFCADSDGLNVAFKTVGNAAARVRCHQPLSDKAWREDADIDFLNRK